MTSSSTELLLGIDIGTQGVKGELVTPGGKVVARASASHACTYPHPDWCEHDMEQNWRRGPFEVIRRLLAQEGIRAEQVQAVSASGLFPAMGPTDAAGRPLAGAILYSDNRALAEVNEVNALFGLQLTSEELTPKLVWFLRRQPELAGRMRMFFDAPHYLVYCLCGEYVTDTILPGLYGAIFHSPSAAWQLEACARLGIPPEILPAVHPPAHIVGGVHAAAAAETGLLPGTPVLAGIPDLVASLISAGAVHTWESVAYYGTAGLVPVMKQDLLEVMWQPCRQEERGLYPNDGYLLDLPVYSLSVGDSARWFRDQFAPLEMQAERQEGEIAYAQLNRLAAAIPPTSDGVLFLPHLQGQRSPVFDPYASGVFFGLRAAHTRPHLFRAVLEAYGHTIRHSLETYYPLGQPLKRLVATGGGARSPLWRQVVSDITGIRQEYIPDADEALGDAYLAGMALGWFNDFETLRQEWIHVEDVTEPDPECKAVYDRSHAVYVALHAALKPVFALASQTSEVLKTEVLKTSEVSIPTLRGTITPAQLGRTLVHEHVFWDFDPRYRRTSLDFTCQELEKLAAFEVDTVVDVGPFDYRSMGWYQAIAHQVKLNIIVSTGFYLQRRTAPEFHEYSVDQLAARFLGEINEGIGGSAVRAGVIKVAGEKEELTPWEMRMCQAAALVQQHSGAPICTHAIEGAWPQFQALLAAGADPQRVYLSHTEHEPGWRGRSVEQQIAYLEQITRQGGSLYFSNFGWEFYSQEANLRRLVLGLCERGYADRLLIGADANYKINEDGSTRWEEQRPHPELPLKNFAYAFTYTVPLLQRWGLSQADLEQFLVHNPRRIFGGK